MLHTNVNIFLDLKFLDIFQFSLTFNGYTVTHVLLDVPLHGQKEKHCPTQVPA